MQRIFKCGDIQNGSFACDEDLNILIYLNAFLLGMSYKLSWFVFCPNRRLIIIIIIIICCCCCSSCCWQNGYCFSNVCLCWCVCLSLSACAKVWKNILIRNWWNLIETCVMLNHWIH